MQDLKELFQIQKFLQEINHPDINRVSQEILTHSQNSNTGLKDIFNRLISNEPWEYIKGSSMFCNKEFIVNNNVLIPRIETEKIVYDIADYILNLNQDITLIDVGTGSGCIPISILSILREKGHKKDLEIIATDISKEALDVAKTNEKNLLEENVIKWTNTHLIQDINTKYDTVITSNLPYIPHEQYLNLDPSVKDYEPQIALEGEPELYIELLQECLKLNKPVKRIYIETEESVINKVATGYERILKNKTFSLVQNKDCFDRDRFIDITLP